MRSIPSPFGKKFRFWVLFRTLPLISSQRTYQTEHKQGLKTWWWHVRGERWQVQGERWQEPFFFCGRWGGRLFFFLIGATIRTCWEMQCLPCAGFFFTSVFFIIIVYRKFAWTFPKQSILEGFLRFFKYIFVKLFDQLNKNLIFTNFAA